MMVSNRGSVLRLLMWQWRLTLILTLSGVGTYVFHHVLGYGWTLPTMPLAVVGAALGIFVSFRTNSAYDRWWEGRKLWGRMINTSRHFTTQVVSYIGAKEETKEVAQTLVRRHSLYVHVLRCQLRQQDPFADPEFQRVLALVGDDESFLREQANLNHALLQLQLDRLTTLANEGHIDALRLQSLDLSISHLLDIQGGCERIKKTPMPRGYGFIAERLVTLYGILFPLAIVVDMGYWVIPINLLVGLSFGLISESGRVLEDPFTMFWNGLPLSNISMMIEVNVRQRLGDTDLPEIPGVNEKGILM